MKNISQLFSDNECGSVVETHAEVGIYIRGSRASILGRMNICILCVFSILVGVCFSESRIGTNGLEILDRSSLERLEFAEVSTESANPTTPNELEDKGSCKDDNDCDNSAKCVVGDGGLRECMCRRGTSGNFCQTVNSCNANPEMCGKETDVKCVYSVDEKKGVCKCDDDNKRFNPTLMKCVVKCDDKNPCQNFGNCSDGVCTCRRATSGEFCQNIWGCPDCGNPKIATCVYNMLYPGGKCLCNREDLVYDDYDKACKNCDCGKNGGVCTFEEGRKNCACLAGFADLLGKCTKCDCGLQTLDCAFSEEGDKVCTCVEGYAQKYDKCEVCDCGERGFSCHYDGYEKVCQCYSDGKEINGTCYSCYCGYDIPCELSETGEPMCECKDASGLLDGRCTECNCGLSGVNCTFQDKTKHCLCPEGYEDKDGKCIEMDYCEDDRDCPATTRCYNRGCECIAGFQKSNADAHPKIEGCYDMDECEGPGICHPSTQCINTPGSFMCECREGYESLKQYRGIRNRICDPITSPWRTPTIILGILIGIAVIVTTTITLKFLKK